MGVYSLQTNQAQPFNRKILLFSVSLLIMFTSSLAFLVYKAEAIFEYAIGFYFCITRSAIPALYLIIWLQMPKIIKFIGNCEQFVETSE